MNDWFKKIKCANVEVRFMDYARKTNETIYELGLETGQIISIQKTVLTLVELVENLEHPKWYMK